AEEAFKISGDPTMFPGQLKYVQPWQPKRLVWNGFRFQQADRPARPEHSVSLDLGGYSALLGKSYSEIAGESRSMHKSQGFGAGQNRGEFVNYFQHVTGDTAQDDLFDGVNTTWSRIPGADTVGRLLDEVYRLFDDENPSGSIPTLLKVYKELSKLSGDPWIDVKKAELLEVVKSCAGIWVDALASEPSAIPGGEVKVAITAINRSEYPFSLERIRLPAGSTDTVFHSGLARNVLVRWNCAIRIPPDIEYTQPFWLREKPEPGSYQIKDQRLVGQPENSPPLIVTLTLATPEGQIQIDAPVRYRFVDPVEGEIYRPFDIIPPVTVRLSEHVYVFPDTREKSIEVSVKSGTNGIRGSLHLNVPPGWTANPDARDFDLKEKNEEQAVTFLLRPANGATSGRLGVEAQIQGKVYNREMVVISYKHIPLQTVFPVEEGKLLRIDVAKAGQNIGYIMGAGDEIPAALRQVGYSVTLISDEELAEGNLAKYDAIVAGVRAYNTRPKLRAAQKRLMDYVQKGGSYIVQYTTLQRGESENLGPYPFNVSHDRVTVEDAPVRFVDPKNPLLNVPNKIGEDDFTGWVQERGLYFADKWDSRYSTVLSSNDPGETPKDGGLLMAKYGKGHYFYSAYAFFRQLPAGVPGAYRLLSNMVSMGRAGIARKAKKD
ncbi:MAG: LmbE family protein, partial [Bacteroidota bacterium]